jgi:S1-C subfamily serine protease
MNRYIKTLFLIGCAAISFFTAWSYYTQTPVNENQPPLINPTHFSPSDIRSIVVLVQGLSFNTQIGTGMIIETGVDQVGPYTLILTANHVVSQTQAASVTFSDGIFARGPVVYRHESTDSAIIRLPLRRDNFRPREIRREPLSDGEVVSAVGWPRGLFPAFLIGKVQNSSFSISANPQNNVTARNSSARFIAADIPAIGGVSGSPVFDQNGLHVGMIVSYIFGQSESEGNSGFTLIIPAADILLHYLNRNIPLLDTSCFAGVVPKIENISSDVRRFLGLSFSYNGECELSRRIPSDWVLVEAGGIVLSNPASVFVFLNRFYAGVEIYVKVRLEDGSIEERRLAT